MVGKTSFSGDGTQTLFPIMLSPSMPSNDFVALVTVETQDFTTGYVLATHASGELRVRFEEAPPLGASFVVHYGLFT